VAKIILTILVPLMLRSPMLHKGTAPFNRYFLMLISNFLLWSKLCCEVLTFTHISRSDSSRCLLNGSLILLCYRTTSTLQQISWMTETSHHMVALPGHNQKRLCHAACVKQGSKVAGRYIIMCVRSTWHSRRRSVDCVEKHFAGTHNSNDTSASVIRKLSNELCALTSSVA